tara:strand:- start:189 stop:443 length:255 start_codon:yes stop_codon:yes gene_type:complete
MNSNPLSFRAFSPVNAIGEIEAWLRTSELYFSADAATAPYDPADYAITCVDRALDYIENLTEEAQATYAPVIAEKHHRFLRSFQ